MRRSLARRAIAFTSASVGLRSVSRSVSRTQLLASRNVGVGMSCSMSGSCMRKQNATSGSCGVFGSQTRCPLLRNTRNKKEEAGFPPPLWSLLELRRFNRTRRTHFVHRLLGCGFRHGYNRNESAAVGSCTKLDAAFDLGEQGMVGADANIKAGMPCGAALTRNDVAGNHVLAAIDLDSEALARRITAVTR